MKPLVIYHANCTDGFAAAFAAWLKLGDEAEYQAWQYGDTNPNIRDCAERDVYMLDFRLPRRFIDELFQRANHVVWLDHHKTAFEMWEIPQGQRVYVENRDTRYVKLHMDKSGALLAWEYFHPNTEVPLLIKHIDDRDRWQWKIEGSAELHAALWSYQPWSFEEWKGIFSNPWGDWRVPDEIIMEGAAILRAQKAAVTGMVKHAKKCTIDLASVSSTWRADNPTGLALNTNQHISEVGHELANQSGTFGLVWYVSNDNRAKCSLRSNGDYDVSEIAKAFGGGGHKNAAGFEVDIETLMGWLS